MCYFQSCIKEFNLNINSGFAWLFLSSRTLVKIRFGGKVLSDMFSVVFKFRAHGMPLENSIRV